VLAIYFGTIFYSVKKLLEVAKKYEYIDPFIGQDDEEETQIQEQNYSLENIKVDKENILYQAVNNEINNNLLDTTKKVLICCTGDYQSMALLTIAMNIFNRENIHVFTFNRNHDSMLEFMENICNENKLAFHHSLCDTDESESESDSEKMSESDSETLSESDSEKMSESDSETLSESDSEKLSESDSETL
jgi:3'-phosphoadenosine 5'-phosphosulfate sulfotransferase (PAPS reductase)/FAD synthetase